MLTLLASCSATDDKFDSREDAVVSALKDNEQYSSFGSKAVWLVKVSSLAPDDRTAAFFGYPDNYAVCMDFVEAYEAATATIDAEIYRCDSID